VAVGREGWDGPKVGWILVDRKLGCRAHGVGCWTLGTYASHYNLPHKLLTNMYMHGQAVRPRVAHHLDGMVAIFCFLVFWGFLGGVSQWGPPVRCVFLACQFAHVTGNLHKTWNNAHAGF
jgi:hypothetical protein